MERIKSLNRYQKGILIVMTAMVILFSVIYSVTISRVGFEYADTILVPGRENESTVYSGKIKGQQACFSISENKTVIFQYGDKTYGPYTVKEDPSAIPKGEEIPRPATGIEVLRGDSTLFRGAFVLFGDKYVLYSEDGTLYDFGFSYITSDGVERNENGNVIDPMEPSVSDILELMNDPKLTHKGEWHIWFGAVLICVINSSSILFADELFRFDLMFQIRNADSAEPSEWEIAKRYIGWTFLTIMALIIFIMGLQ